MYSQQHPTTPRRLAHVENDKLEANKPVWYFSYGSNLTSETFRAHRGITPLATLPVYIPGWMLVFDVYGLPYSEPAFASISPIPFRDDEEKDVGETPPLVHGTAYLLDPASYISVVASEGGGTAYDEIELLAVSVTDNESNTIGTQPFSVMTLVKGYGPTIGRCPSRRYKDLICVGAKEAELPKTYQTYLDNLPCYDAPQSRWTWRWIGCMLFLAWWSPVMAAAEKLTQATENSDGTGYCPKWVRFTVRFILYVMWLHHDYIHAPIWGRGDGLDKVTRAGRVEWAISPRSPA
uniref:gamma-glutamylcyclotransferase n=2 Tax=Penicillium steckii TaxID=303698 RepID=A0A7T1TT89_9EURO|nr:Pen4-2 [Penicillium steckii]